MLVHITQMSTSLHSCVQYVSPIPEWQEVDDAVCVCVWTCRSALLLLEVWVCVCVSRLQPLVWWIPLVAARQWHDLLPRSGADWLQYRPYINLVGEKRWKDGESRHSTEMGRATKYTSLLPDGNSPERLEWESDIFMQLFLSSSCYCYQTWINEKLNKQMWIFIVFVKVNIIFGLQVAQNLNN